MQTENVLHIISHTDLDGVVSAPLARHANRSSGLPIKVSLMGYGEIDNAILESLASGQKLTVSIFSAKETRQLTKLTDFHSKAVRLLYLTITKAPMTGTATGNGL